MLSAALLLSLTAPAAEPVRLPDGSALAEVDFERHVVSLFGRAGCNTGACHGSFQGKGGFRLSLFGHEPARDFRALTRDAEGRRVDPHEPDHSLLLLKATGQVPHGGGRRIAPDSWQYQVLRDWIAGGCRHHPKSGDVARLEVEPREHDFRKPGETIDLRVRAVFADGTSADVAAFCDFRAKDESVADVTDHGRVRADRAGDTAIVVAYRGTAQAMRVYVPFAESGRPGTAGTHHAPVADGPGPPRSSLDREVFAKLGRLNIRPSGLAGDEDFLRRVTIDTIGSLPTPAEVRAFVADRRPDKRSRKIDELLAHPRHAALWAMKLCDITGCNVDVMDGPPELRAKHAQMWHDWFRARVAANVPYHQIVRGVLLATTREGGDVKSWLVRDAELDREAKAGFASHYADRRTLDLFWRRVENGAFWPLEKMAEQTAAAFLGVRLECAQCHKHPFDRWTQVDYRGFANVFGQMRYDASPELAALDKKAGRRSPDEPPERMVRREVYVADRRLRALPHPEGRDIVKPHGLGGPDLADTRDPREGLFAWMVEPNNPYFAKSFVNRVVAHFLGVGIVDPVDDFSAANPPSNERLLDALAAEFVASGYDIRKLERSILTSEVYQLSSRPNASNKHDRTNYSHAYPRPMAAEVVLDVLNDALGAGEDFGADARPGSRAIEVATNRVTSPHAARVFRVFGRPARATTCDCERPTGPALSQTLYLMSDPALLRKLTGGRLRALLANSMSDSEVVDELFLATLSRFPDLGEKRAALERIGEAETHSAGCVDVLWALINTREFVLNH